MKTTWPESFIGAILGGKRDLHKLATVFVDWAARESVKRFATQQVQSGYDEILITPVDKRYIVARRVWLEASNHLWSTPVWAGSGLDRNSSCREGTTKLDITAEAVAHGLWLMTLDQTIVCAPGGALTQFAKAGLTWQEQNNRLLEMLTGPWEVTERAA